MSESRQRKRGACLIAQPKTRTLDLPMGDLNGRHARGCSLVAGRSNALFRTEFGLVLYTLSACDSACTGSTLQEDG